MKRFALVATLLALAAPHAVFAQVDRATVSGLVKDSGGAVVAGASVTVTNLATNVASQQTTTETGSYLVVNLIPGQDRIDVELSGFKKRSQTVTLEVGQRARVDMPLEVGNFAETVDVAGASPILKTSEAALGSVIAEIQVANLPLAIRNWDDLLALVPGVQGDRYTEQGGGTSFGRTGGINVHGARALQNNFLLDGVDNNSISENVQELTTQVSRPSVDAIQEFKVVTSPYSAEYGRSPGAAISVSTKSGTNLVRGTAYEYFRNESLDSTDFFTKRAGAVKPTNDQNQVGGNLGGPIIKDAVDHDRHVFGELTISRAMAAPRCLAGGGRRGYTRAARRAAPTSPTARTAAGAGEPAPEAVRGARGSGGSPRARPRPAARRRRPRLRRAARRPRRSPRTRAAGREISGAQGRGVGVIAVGAVEVEVPEAPHRRRGEAVAVREARGGRGVERHVADRVHERLHPQPRPALVAQAARGDGRQVGARAVAGHREPGPVPAERAGVVGEPAQRSHRLVDRYRERVLGRQAIADADHEGARCGRERPRHAIERRDRADRPTAAVQVGDDRQPGRETRRVGAQGQPAVRAVDHEVADAGEPRTGPGQHQRVAVVLGAEVADGGDIRGEEHCL